MKKKKNHLVLDVYFVHKSESLKSDMSWVYCGNYTDFTSAEEYINSELLKNGGCYILCIRSFEYDLYITYKIEDNVLTIDYLQ